MSPRHSWSNSFERRCSYQSLMSRKWLRAGGFAPLTVHGHLTRIWSALFYLQHLLGLNDFLPLFLDPFPLNLTERTTLSPSLFCCFWSEADSLYGCRGKGGPYEHQQIDSKNKHPRVSSAFKQTKYSVVSGGLQHTGLFCDVHVRGIQSISQVALNFWKS